MTVKINCTPHRQWWWLYSNLFFVISFVKNLFFSSFVALIWCEMIRDALHVAMLLDMCLSVASIMVIVLLGLLSAKAGSAHQGWEEWWNCAKVKESSVHVVSISVCLKISGGLSTEYPLQLNVRWGNSSQDHPFWLCLTVCLCGNCYTWMCVPWVCRLCALDKIFFWWPARFTPILDNSL